jgi:hypothetical protein
LMPPAGETRCLGQDAQEQAHAKAVGQGRGRAGASPYSLILLGDDMLLFDREEYDPEQGTWQALAPGDPGRADR